MTPAQAIAEPASGPVVPEASPPTPAWLRAWRLLVLGLLTAFAPMSIDIYLPAFGQIGQDLRASPGEVQATLVVFFVGLALGAVVLGAAVGSARPQTPAAGSHRAVCAGLAWLRAGEPYRAAHRLARAAGPERLRRHCAGAQHGARWVRSRASGAGVLASDAGAGSGAHLRTASRRLAGAACRLALGVWRAGGLRPAVSAGRADPAGESACEPAPRPRQGQRPRRPNRRARPPLCRSLAGRRGCKCHRRCRRPPRRSPATHVPRAAARPQLSAAGGHCGADPGQHVCLHRRRALGAHRSVWRGAEHFGFTSVPTRWG
jgi:hypothetical protein